MSTSAPNVTSVAASVVTSLVSQYGSNRSLAPEVGRLSRGCTTAKVVFAGGMCEVRYLQVRTLIINDLHRHVINLARVTRVASLRRQLQERASQRICHPDELRAAQLRCIEREQAFDRGGGLFGGRTPDPLLAPDVEWAVDYFVCGNMSRHGTAGTRDEFEAPLSIRKDAGGGDSARHYRSATEALAVFETILEPANFTTLDFREFLQEYCQDRDDEFIYCDPPFPGPGDLYKHAFAVQDHRDLARRLTLYKSARVVCRFYRHPLVEQLYQEADGWRCIGLEGGKKQTNEAAPELLVVRNVPAEVLRA